MNDIILNPDKLQAMIMSCYKKENKHDLNKNNSIDSFTLLDIEIDNKLSFEKHISTIYKKARRQLNAIN